MNESLNSQLTQEEVPSEDHIEESDTTGKTDLEDETQIGENHMLELEIDGVKFTLKTTKSNVEYPEYLQKETGGVIGHERISISWENITQLVLKLSNMEEYQVNNLNQLWQLLNFSARIKESYKKKIPNLFIPESIRETGTMKDLYEYLSNEKPYIRFATKSGFKPNKPNTKNRLYRSEEEFNQLLAKDVNFKVDIDSQIRETAHYAEIIINNPGINLDDQILKFVETPDFEDVSKMTDKLLESLCSVLSDGRFIKDTYNHYSRGIKADIFKKQKLYLQKIKSPELYVELLENEDDEGGFNDNAFDYINIDTNEICKGIDGEEKFKMSMESYDKKSGFNQQLSGKAKEDELEKLHNIRQYLTDNRLFLLSLTKSGLDVQDKKLWGGDASLWNTLLQSTVYGFSTSNKSFAHYMNSVDKIFDSVFENKKKNQKITQYGNASDSDDIHTKYFLGFYLKEKAIAVDPSPNSDKGREYSGKIWSKFSARDDLYAHQSIPICIGHPNIPELRWCHAQYASMPTKKGLNFLTFKS